MDKRVWQEIAKRKDEVRYYLRLTRKQFGELEFSETVFYSKMIESEKAERRRELMQAAVFPEYLQGKFKEKSWSKLINNLGIGEPENRYTKEDRERDLKKSDKVIEKLKKARYERVV